MAGNLCLIAIHNNPTFPTSSLTFWTHHRPKLASFEPRRLPISPAPSFPVPGEPRRRRSRGVSVVTRAGPNANTYILAFVLPFSLIVLTVFASLKISDKLDERYLEEVLLSEAIREANDDDDSDDDGIEFPVEQPVTPRTRNRPKREI